MIGRFFLRLIPWWMFAIFAFSFAPLTLEVAQDELANRAAFQEALTSAQPDPVPLATLSTRPRGGLAGEINITARWRRDLGISEIEEDGVNHAYALLEATSGPPRFVAVYVPAYQADRLGDILADAADPNDVVQLGGFISPSLTGFSDVQDDMRRRGLTGKFFPMEPILGAREAAIREQMNGSWIMLGVMGAFQAAFVIMAIVKFRAWRKRRRIAKGVAAAKRKRTAPPAAPARPPRTQNAVSNSPFEKAPDRPAAPVPTPQPAPAPREKPLRRPATQTKKNDGYADSPIQTQKGWFR